MMTEFKQRYEVLLIDDDEDEHYIFKTALARVNYTGDYLTAYGWKQAEKILSHVVPDFIFLDMNLPGKNGIDCLKEIKQKQEFKSVPVYLYSTGMSDLDCYIAIKIGAEDCIKKTASIQQLSNMLSKILRH